MESDWKPGGRRGKVQKGNSKDNLDDILGDLLSDDPVPKKKPQSQPAAKSKAASKNSVDDDFYSNLAAMADNEESEVSEADVSQMARSIADLEDMDADLFGGQRSNSTKARAGRQSTPRRTPTPRSNKSPSGARSGSPPLPTGSPTVSPRSESIKRRPPSENKPGSAPGKMTDIYASSTSRSRYSTGQDLERPGTVPKAKPKFTFGEFDEDDPLKGLLSDDEDDFGSKKKPDTKTEVQPSGDDLGESQTENMMRNREAQSESPRRRNLFERPPTRSGTNSGTQDSSPSAETVIAAPVKSAPAPKRQEAVFSDDDDSLLGGLGIDEKKPNKPKQQSTSLENTENKPAKSIMDSLLGKDSVSKQLEPKERKEFVLDKKYNKPEEDTDGFVFGGYQPSAASDGGSRPTSRRSVRFQDDDDIFGVDKPLSRGGSRPPSRPSKSNDLDWLEMASGSKKPTSRETTPNVEKKQSSSNADWLGLQDTNTDDDTLKPSQKQQPDTSPRIETDKKSPVQTKLTERRNSSDWLGLKSGDEDYLGLGTEVDPDTLLNNKPASPLFGERRSSVDDIFSTPARRDSNSSMWSSGTRQKRTQSPRVKSSSSPRLDNVNDGEPLLAVGSPRVSLQSQLKQLQKLDELDQQLPETTKKIMQRPASPNLSKPSTPLTLTSDTLYSISDEQRDFLFKDSEERLSTTQTLPQQKPPTPPAKVSVPPSPSIMQTNGAQHAQLLQQQEELQRRMEALQKQYQSATKPQTISQSDPSFLKTVGFGPAPVRQAPFDGQAPVRQAPFDLGMDPQSAMIQKLQIEVEYLRSMNETSKKRYDEETSAVENSYKSRIQLLEETHKRREERWKEENDLLMSQHMNRIRQLEQEKLDMSANSHRKCEDIDRERSQDIERLTQIHRNALNNIKKEHEEDIARIKRIKDQEIDAVANAHDTSKSLNAVVEQIHSNAKDLGGLQEKVDTWHRMGLDEREIHIRSKDEQLKLLQVRLEKQQADNDIERQRLEDLIARLETQLREQTRLIDEDRWKIKQEQTKLQSMQGSLDEERKVWAEQQLRERAAIDRSKEQLLEEQRAVLNQLYEEKKLLAQDRAEFDVKLKVNRDEEHQMAIKLTQARAEYEALSKVITDEKSFSDGRMKEIQREEQRLQEERRKIEMEKAEIDQEKREQCNRALQVKHRSEEIEEMCNSAAISRDEGERALAQAKMIESEQQQRLAQINAQMQSLRAKEKQLSEDRVHTAKEKKDVDNMKSSMLCYNCRIPLKSAGENAADMNVTAPPVMNGAANQNPVYYTNVYQTNLNTIETINAKIAADKNVRLWKLQAMKDKEFLEEESLFLEALKHSPYNAGNS